jgi:putative ABC transport system permease protein
MFSNLIRSNTRRPGSSALIVSMLTLAIGASTAIYSVAKAVILTPLPFPNPDRLVHIFEGSATARYQPGGENILSSVRPGSFQDWRQNARCFANVSAVQISQSLLMAGDRASVVDALRVDEAFFQTLRVPASLGRSFTADDFAADGGRVVVLGDRLWRSEFNADPSVLGREITLDGAATRVVGIMPRGFLPTRYDRDPQLWIPLRWTPATRHSRDLWGHFVYARLKDGVPLQQAQAEMSTIAARSHSANPESPSGAVVVPLDGYLFGHHERLFLILLSAVGLVLLIACANVANLLLARAVERQREFAVRSALGASRAAILRQVLRESLVMAGAGGILGAALSPLLIRPILALVPTGSKIPRLDQVHIDAGVLVFTIIVSIAAGLLFGVGPALRAGRGDLSEALRGGGRGSSLGKGDRRIGDALIVSEVALSLVLLSGGGLLMRAFLKLLYEDPGFRPTQAVALQLAVPSSRYGVYQTGGENLPRRQLYNQIEQAARAIPAIESAGLTAKLPLRQFWNPWAVGIEGRTPVQGPDGSAQISGRFGFAIHGEISTQTVSPGYFAAIGVALVRGRLLDEHDRPDAPMAAVINLAAVRRFFPNQDPIGKRLVLDMTSFAPHVTIVGVVGDSRLDGMDKDALPEIFLPMAHLPSAGAWLVARARGQAASIENTLRVAVRNIDPEIGQVELSTMTDVLGNSLWRQRLSAVLVGFFAILAALIASGGLYGVIAYTVARRTRELGVRIALGAGRVQVAATVLGHGLRVTAMGIAAGTVLSLAAERVFAQEFPGVENSVWMLAAVSALLLVLSMLACWSPVRSALAVDPLMALRSE